MSQTMASLNRKIDVVADLQTVVKTMKNISASSIGQYNQSLHSLTDYYRTIELGLGVCLRRTLPSSPPKMSRPKTGIIVFGSDQGLVGQFNEVVSKEGVHLIDSLEGNALLWAVGERVRVHLSDYDFDLTGTFPLPNSIKTITNLVSKIIIEMNDHDFNSEYDVLYLVYNQRTSGVDYTQKVQRLLPLDKVWQEQMGQCHWPSKNSPEIVGTKNSTLKALIQEYLFVSIFKACTESLASENSRRLSAMQRADKNIRQLLKELRGKYHRFRQDSIDEELFDLIAGFEALSKKKH